MAARRPATSSAGAHDVAPSGNCVAAGYLGNNDDVDGRAGGRA